MRYLIHEDAAGFRWRRGIPNDAPASQAKYGTSFGPPDLSEIAEQEDWPPAFYRRIHNQLCDRELWTWADVRRAGGMRALTSAVLHAAKGDAGRIAEVYQRLDSG